MSSFISRNLTEIEAVAECTFACISNTVFRMFSCLQINCQPFYLRQLLKFHPFDWMIEIYLQTEGQGTHHKMLSLQPMTGFFASVSSCKILQIKLHFLNYAHIIMGFTIASEWYANSTFSAHQKYYVTRAVRASNLGVSLID